MHTHTHTSTHTHSHTHTRTNTHTHTPNTHTHTHTHTHTAGITQLDNHQSPVVSIKPISADTPTSSSIGHVVSLLNKERDDDDGGSTGLSFQLATLDRYCGCVLNAFVIWHLYSLSGYSCVLNVFIVTAVYLLNVMYL